MELDTIICGDSAQVLKTFPDNFVDLTVTSPPYDGLRKYNGFSFDFETIAKELFRVTKDGGVVVWIVGDATVKGGETLSSFKQAIYFVDTCGFRMHDTMIYQKSNFSFPANNRYHQIFEYMFVLSKGSPKTFNGISDRPNVYVGQKPHGKMRNGNGGWEAVSSSRKLKEDGIGEFGLRYNVWRVITGGGHVTKDKIAYQHPAIFPEELAKDHILSWSNEGNTVLDCFAGSGTTLKMAKTLNRRYIGIEISQEYIDIAKQRLELPLFVDNSVTV